MALDGRLLARARDALAAKRRQFEDENRRRTKEVYERVPAVREIDEQLRSSVMDVVGYALSRGEDPTERLEEILEDNRALRENRAAELMAWGYPADYLDEKYHCEKCRDSGSRGPQLCSCLMELYREEQRKELSQMLKVGEETFDAFELDWYSAEPDPNTGISDRDSMEMVYEMCVSYAHRFGEKSPNLLMTGGTGLGKTFLSTCIAKEVAEKGFSVVYDTATTVFARFEEEKFSRADDVETAKSDINRYQTCDLLILDDLGTEMMTNFVMSALYTLINTRLTSGKKTVISTNLSPEDLRRRYSPQIASRLEGEYIPLKFHGRDIRLMRRERI